MYYFVLFLGGIFVMHHLTNIIQQTATRTGKDKTDNHLVKIIISKIKSITTNW